MSGFFLRRIRAKADAADLAQEVYVRMLRISDQEAIRNPVHYLYTVANKRSRSPTIFVPSLYRRYGLDGPVIDLNRQSIACCQGDACAALAQQAPCESRS